MHSKFVFLRQYFSNIGYPLGTVNSHIKKFLAKHFENYSEQIERNSFDQICFFSLLFFGPNFLKSMVLKLCYIGPMKSVPITL